MKVITIKQPWASLIVHCIKDIENRTWACPKKYIGQRVLIHASSCSWTWHRVLNYMTKPMLAIFEKLGYNGKWVRCQPTGSIIGSIQIVDCVINHPSIWAEKTEVKADEYGLPYYGDKTYNWVLANPILFPEPIPAKGKLSFWEYENMNSEDDICLCNIPVEEKNQVTSICGEYRCHYCGGKWYK